MHAVFTFKHEYPCHDLAHDEAGLGFREPAPLVHKLLQSASIAQFHCYQGPISVEVNLQIHHAHQVLVVKLAQDRYVQAIALLKNLGDGKQRADAYRDGQVRVAVS